MSIPAIRLDDQDDVAIVLAPATNGASLRLDTDGFVLKTVEAIPQHHKVALRDLPPGSGVRRDAIVIGRTTAFIPRGAHVHVHNLKSLRASSTKGDIS